MTDEARAPHDTVEPLPLPHQSQDDIVGEPAPREELPDFEDVMRAHLRVRDGEDPHDVAPDLYPEVYGDAQED